MGQVSKAYLLIYNTLQLCGWSLALWTTVQTYVETRSHADVYQAAAPFVRLFQGAAFLEVVHGLTGIIRGSAVTALLQWLGRSNVLFGVLGSISEVQQGWPVTALFTVWALSEVIRYPWYAISQLRQPPDFLTWLRYTMFIPLYPVGVIAEVAIIWRALPIVKQQKLHSLEMPNWYNWGYSYYWLNLVALLVIYPLAWPWLYNTLLQQRRRRLGRKEESKAA